MQTKFLGNCSEFIDWESIVHTVSKRPGKLVTTDKSQWKYNTNPVYGEFIKMWEEANFNVGSVRWINYYPGEDFGDDVVAKFEELYQVTRLKVWISRIDPGYCTPWHWDTDDNEAEWINQGNIRRFICFMDPPQIGHMLAMEDHCFYKEAVGNVYEWENFKLWHAGTNCGLTPKFLFNFLGYD